jgi:hypothetical protein
VTEMPSRDIRPSSDIDDYSRPLQIGTTVSVFLN